MQSKKIKSYKKMDFYYKFHPKNIFLVVGKKEKWHERLIF